MTKLNERNNNSSLKDEIIFGLKSQITILYNQARKFEQDKKDL